MPEAEFNVDACLDALEQGDRSILPRLFDHFRPRLSQLVRMRRDGRLSARAESSDVLQETYLDVTQQIDGYLARRREIDFYVWLRGITMQRLGKFHRYHLGTQRRAVGREIALPNRSSLILFQQLAATQSTPSQHFEKHELHRHMQQALEALSVDDREVILMRHFEFLSNREVAQVLQINESTATMRYGRALVRLREYLLKDDRFGMAST